MHSLINGTSVQITLRFRFPDQECQRENIPCRVMLLNKKMLHWIHPLQHVGVRLEGGTVQQDIFCCFGRDTSRAWRHFLKIITHAFLLVWGSPTYTELKSILFQMLEQVSYGLEYTYTAVQFNQYYSTAAWIFVAWILIFNTKIYLFS